MVPVTVPRGLPASSDPARVTVTWPLPVPMAGWYVQTLPPLPDACICVAVSALGVPKAIVGAESSVSLKVAVIVRASLDLTGSTGE